jgi:RNA polymerase sigma-70 factor (ECF subfamily)
LTDHELISGIIDGDESAFKRLVELYQDKTYSICLGYLRNEEDAEDTAQEVFIELFRSIYKFKGESGLNTWVYRIAVNKSLELIRKRKTKKRFGFLNSLFGNEDIIERNYADFKHPGVQLENKERASVLLTHIEKLPDSQRTAFQLHKMQEMSYQEISDTMNTSLSSVESLIFRAKKNLQKSLKYYYENDKTQ